MTVPYKAPGALPLGPPCDSGSATSPVAETAQDANQGPTSANGEHADSAVRGELCAVFGEPPAPGELAEGAAQAIAKAAARMVAAGVGDPEAWTQIQVMARRIADGGAA